MAALFAYRVIDGRTVFGDVPRLLKNGVADILINVHKRPELVPTEFGGTAE